MINQLTAALTDFKSSTLRAHGAEPTAQRIEIPVDLRRDWPTALRQAGFHSQAPTAWSVEGLLRYLPSQTQDLLFERIHEMSAVGSQVVANAPTDDVLDPERWVRDRELGQRLQSALGLQVGTMPPNVEELSYAEERTDVIDWLAEHGWEASGRRCPKWLPGIGGALPTLVRVAPYQAISSPRAVCA